MVRVCWCKLLVCRLWQEDSFHPRDAEHRRWARFLLDSMAFLRWWGSQSHTDGMHRKPWYPVQNASLTLKMLDLCTKDVGFAVLGGCCHIAQTGSLNDENIYPWAWSCKPKHHDRARLTFQAVVEVTQSLPFFTLTAREKRKIFSLLGFAHGVL